MLDTIDLDEHFIDEKGVTKSISLFSSDVLAYSGPDLLHQRQIISGGKR